MPQEVDLDWLRRQMSAPTDDSFQSQTHKQLKELVMITTKTNDALEDLRSAARISGAQQSSLSELNTALNVVAQRGITFTPEQRRLVHAAVTEVFGPSREK